MRRTASVVLLVSVLFAAPWTVTQADAQLLCTDPNLLAFVFDNGDINLDAGPGLVAAHAIILNPDFTDLYGFELAYHIEGNAMITSIELHGNGPIDVGGALGNHIVGLASPTHVTGSQVMIATVSIFIMDTNPNLLYLDIPQPPSIPGCTSVLLAGDQIICVYPISDDYDLPVAAINPEYPLEYCNQGVDYVQSVRISSGGDLDNYAATAYGASDGYDANDIVDPAGGTGVYFPRSNWISAEEEPFRTDVREPFDPLVEAKQWTFVVDTPFIQSGDQMVTVSFDPSFEESSGNALTLIDHTTGYSHSLWPDLSYSYWIYADDERLLELVVGEELPQPDPLSVVIFGSSGAISDEANIAGTAENATDGFDGGLDVPEPGPPPADYLTLSFPHEDWPLGTRYSRDYRALYDPRSESRTWRFTVETDRIGDIILGFDPSFTFYDTIPLMLKDLSNGQTYDLFPNCEYSYWNATPSIRGFELTIGGEGIPLPALEPTRRILPAGWSMVAMPLQPPAGATLEDVLLSSVLGYGYLFDYPSTSGYSQCAASDPAVYGAGYWFATDESFVWTMDGTPSQFGITLDLRPGWNLLGNPMWFPCPVDGIRVIYNGSTYTWDDAVGLGVVSPLMDYDRLTDAYVHTYDLVAWHAYWFRALEENVSLVFDWENFIEVPARLLSTSKRTAPLPTWTGTIAVDVPGDEVPRAVVFGAHENAADGFDARYDLPAPPSSPSGGSRLVIQHPDWDIPGGAYFVQDLVNPEQKWSSWDILLTSQQSGEATFSWERDGWPDGLDFQLYLPESNRVVVMSMLEQDSVTLEVEGGHLLVQVRTPDMMSAIGDEAPELAWRLSAYPNPFNPLTELHFEVPRGCSAEICIYSVRGELISRIGSGHYEVGRHAVSWNGTDRSGRNVPSGSYFARMVADGQQVGDVVKMSLIR